MQEMDQTGRYALRQWHPPIRVSVALDLPIGTVKSRIARGRRMLIEKLGNQDHPDERQTSNPPTQP